MATKKAKTKSKPSVKKAAPVTKAVAAALGAGTVLGELASACKLSPKKDEKVEDYAARVCEAVSKLSDDAFGKLSKGAQAWYDKAVDAINEEKALPPAPASSGAAAKSEPAPATESKAKTNGKAKGGKKAAKAPKEKKEKKEKVDSIATTVRKMVCSNPEIGFEAVAKKLDVDAESGTANHVWNVFNHTKKVLEVQASLKR